MFLHTFRSYITTPLYKLTKCSDVSVLLSQFKCCGVTNKTDWYEVLNGTLPSSCCSVRTEHCTDGWSEVGLKHREQHLWTVTWVVSSFPLRVLCSRAIRRPSAGCWKTSPLSWCLECVSVSCRYLPPFIYSARQRQYRHMDGLMFAYSNVIKMFKVPSSLVRSWLWCSPCWCTVKSTALRNTLAESRGDPKRMLGHKLLLKKHQKETSTKPELVAGKTLYINVFYIQEKLHKLLH